MPVPSKPRRSALNLDRRELQAFMREATSHAQDQEGTRIEFRSVLEEMLPLPFTIRLSGLEVALAGIHLTDGVGGGERLPSPILDIPIPSSPPRGTEWIAACPSWRRR
jgi:hypothetical protein